MKTKEEKLAQEEAEKKAQQEESKGKKLKVIRFGEDGSEMGKIHEIGKHNSITVKARVEERLVQL